MPSNCFRLSRYSGRYERTFDLNRSVAATCDPASVIASASFPNSATICSTSVFISGWGGCSTSVLVSGWGDCSFAHFRNNSAASVASISPTSTTANVVISAARACRVVMITSTVGASGKKNSRLMYDSSSSSRASALSDREATSLLPSPRLRRSMRLVSLMMSC